MDADPRKVPINAPTVPITTTPNTTSNNVLVEGRLIAATETSFLRCLHRLLSRTNRHRAEIDLHPGAANNEMPQAFSCGSCL